jgi:hypothetical protein
MDLDGMGVFAPSIGGRCVDIIDPGPVYCKVK